MGDGQKVRHAILRRLRRINSISSRQDHSALIRAMVKIEAASNSQPTQRIKVTQPLDRAATILIVKPSLV